MVIVEVGINFLLLNGLVFFCHPFLIEVSLEVSGHKIRCQWGVKAFNRRTIGVAMIALMNMVFSRSNVGSSHSRKAFGFVSWWSDWRTFIIYGGDLIRA